MSDGSPVRTGWTRVEYHAGAIAGLVAGIAMSMFMMALSAAGGRSVWSLPNLIAAMWMGREVADGRLSIATYAGFATHLATSGLMGLVAIPFIAGLPRWRVLLLSIAYALASYTFVFTLVITWANPLMIERTRIVEMTAGHAVFGITLGALYPALAARLSPREKVPPRRSRGGTG